MRFSPGCNCCGGGSLCFLFLSECASGFFVNGLNVSVVYNGPTSGDTFNIPVETCTSSGQVENISVTNPGSGYTSAPAVVFTNIAGTGAAAFATLSSYLNTLTLTSGGSGYSSVPTVTLTGGGGSGATAACGIKGSVASLSLTGAGSGYSSAPTVTLTGGGGSGATATATVGGGIVTGLTLVTAGSNYTSDPTVSFSGGGGTGATATSAISGSVYVLNVVTRGSGYSSDPTVVFSGGGGSGASGTSTIRTDQVASVTITNRGSGYTDTPGDPGVSLVGGGGSGATLSETENTGCCFTPANTGYYAYTVTSSNPEWAGITGTFNVSAGASGDISVTIPVGAGYWCPCIGCIDPTPTTLFVTDPNGTISCTVNPLTGSEYVGSYVIAGSSPAVTVTYQISCALDSTTHKAAWFINQSWTDTLGHAGGTGFIEASALAGAPLACLPVNSSFTMPGTAKVPGSVTVTS